MAKSSLSLPRIIVQDMWSHKWLLLLSFIVFFNAVAVVYTSYVSRQLTTKWDQQLQQRDKLDIEWRNLLLEEQSLADSSRITRIATKELDMTRPLPSEEVVVKIP